MRSAACHADAETPARALLLTTLGVQRVARWCGVSEAAVYQWLHRGTATAPVPASRVPAIAKGAALEGLDFDLGDLWPAMAGFKASGFASGSPGNHIRAAEDLQ